MAEGRLSLDEGVERLDAVFRARERGQLDVLVADLPGRPAPGSTGEVVRRGGGLPTVGLAVVAAAALAQMAAGAWVLWPVAVALLVAVARRRQG